MLKKKQARKEANEAAFAMDGEGGGEAARAAAESAAKEEATSRKPPRIDVSKLADFRYSKIKVGGRETRKHHK